MPRDARLGPVAPLEGLAVSANRSSRMPQRGEPMVSRVIPVDAFDLVIFGATGDLARRKILPGLYRRFLAGQMPADSRIIGAARADMTRSRLPATGPRGDRGVRQQGQARRGGDRRVPRARSAMSPSTRPASGGWATLKARDARRTWSTPSTSRSRPRCSAIWRERLHDHGIADARSRIVVEKPFGRDLASATALNAMLAAAFHRKRRSTGSTTTWARRPSRT